ncbi:hypothetical protein LX16_4589 [Stackebrandtia albiflava]|uniref:Uncharacterized protein n=1 Tax=Stackebrandtia albiflava TaxID=406432 RepID=A0A562URX1_9ACTN|nr:cell division protein ZapA [Stackebrandtia albiflava]TWJ08361.1 hypothetical protein LX16_4589 [Stackebrandtia albiflava]
MDYKTLRDLEVSAIHAAGFQAGRFADWLETGGEAVRKHGDGVTEYMYDKAGTKAGRQLVTLAGPLREAAARFLDVQGIVTGLYSQMQAYRDRLREIEAEVQGREHLRIDTATGHVTVDPKTPPEQRQAYQKLADEYNKLIRDMLDKAEQADRDTRDALAALAPKGSGKNGTGDTGGGDTGGGPGDPGQVEGHPPADDKSGDGPPKTERTDLNGDDPSKDQPPSESGPQESGPVESGPVESGPAEEPPGDEQGGSPTEPGGPLTPPTDPYDPDAYEPAPYEPYDPEEYESEPGGGLAGAGVGGGSGGGIGGAAAGSGPASGVGPASGGTGGLPAGTGTGGGGTGATGMAGRGFGVPMGMMGGGGHGMGGDSAESTWLTEDDDPFGTGEAAPGVIGSLPQPAAAGPDPAAPPANGRVTL